MGAHERWRRMTLTTTTSRCCESLSSSVSSFSNDIFRRRLLSLSSSSRAETRPSSSEGRSIDDYAEKERRMCSRNSRASTSGRRTSLNTNNVKNKNYVNRRMFASDASPLVSSTIGETKKKKKSKNAAASRHHHLRRNHQTRTRRQRRRTKTIQKTRMKTKRIIKVVVLSSLPLKMMKMIHSEGTKPVVCQRKRFRNEEEVKRGRRENKRGRVFINR